MMHVTGNGSPTKRFLFHPLFDGYFRQRSTVVAAMASNPPFFDPLLLDIRLPALRTHKHALDVMYFPNFFHTVLLAIAAQDRIGIVGIARRAQPRWPCPVMAPGDVLTQFRTPDRMPA